MEANDRQTNGVSGLFELAALAAIEAVGVGTGWEQMRGLWRDRWFAGSSLAIPRFTVSNQITGRLYGVLCLPRESAQD